MKRSDLFLSLSLLFFSATAILFVSSRQSHTQSEIALSVFEPQCQQQSGGDGVTSGSQPRNEVVKAELDYEAHVANLKKTTGRGFTIVVEKPFVVIGDQSQADVERWATGTIRWAVSQIKDSYFEKDPDHIINIWLFKDSDSYNANTKKIFGRKPTTPFGYYSPSDKALVMNISTGGGTLVHEIVHPFMAANFEACPSWFNEGLASLYEQSSEREGKIVGLTNWRLRGLQLAIKDDLLGSFKKMMSTNDREFYEGDSTNYAQARYLCFWLQESGVLHDYYHAFVKNAADDPEGIQTLTKILGTEDLEKFQSHWEAYVLKLRFP